MKVFNNYNIYIYIYDFVILQGIDQERSYYQATDKGAMMNRYEQQEQVQQDEGIKNLNLMYFGFIIVI